MSTIVLTTPPSQVRNANIAISNLDSSFAARQLFETEIRTNPNSTQGTNALAQENRQDTHVEVGQSSENPIILYDSEDEELQLEMPENRSHIEQVKEDSEPFECPICFECQGDKGKVATISGCTHLFCFECIKQSSNRSNLCPLCRREFVSITSQDKSKHFNVESNTRRADLSSQRLLSIELLTTDDIPEPLLRELTRALRAHYLQDMMIMNTEESGENSAVGQPIRSHERES